LTVLLSPALSLPRGGPHAGEYTTPGRGRQPAARGVDGARTLATWPPAADAIPQKRLRPLENDLKGNPAFIPANAERAARSPVVPFRFLFYLV